MQTVQPQIVHKGPLMCIIIDGTHGFFIRYTAENPWVPTMVYYVHMAFVFTKTGTNQCYLGANTWCGYYCLMTASSS